MPDDSRRSTVVDNAEAAFPHLTSEAAPFPPDGRLPSQEELRARRRPVELRSRIADRIVGGEADRRPAARMGSVLGSYLRSVLGEKGTVPADIGMESAPASTSPHRASGDWGLRIALVAVLFLMALCTAFALNSYVSERLMAVTQQHGLDTAAERFRTALSTAAGRQSAVAG